MSYKYITDGRLRKRAQKQREALLVEQTHTGTRQHSGEYKSCVTGELFTVPTPTRGCLRKFSVMNDPVDESQSEFLRWAWQIGETCRKKKLSSRQAATLMRKHGTLEGQLMYPHDAYWRDHKTGRVTFRRRKCLSH